MSREIKLSPSLLSSDYSRLGEELDSIGALGATMVHLDVMDGHFVPNITIGAPVIKSLRKHSKLCFDAHLMIENPLRFVESFAEAGADIICFHAECGSIPETIRKIRESGAKPALAIKPKTPASEIFEYLNDIDMVLVMTVEPGYGGQKLIEATLEKISAVRAECDRLGLDMDIEVDGGIDKSTAPLVKEHGANVLVSGSYIFGAKDRASAIKSLL